MNNPSSILQMNPNTLSCMIDVLLTKLDVSNLHQRIYGSPAFEPDTRSVKDASPVLVL